VLENIAQRSGQSIQNVERDFLANNRPPSLLGRFSTPRKSPTLVDVCSQRAPATSGTALRVDGGVVRSIM